ncbi:hypothetical protein NM688_g7895 [Phlebia brevispora]|uniref:Uncharacterized protein n=1 Tax=Phlebia brevispora TaxID=194682 RepID=A0ACC1RZY2_9APHY|nr:hypothetical protein NM688_g7895 [Phlebia brevispora]
MVVFDDSNNDLYLLTAFIVATRLEALKDAMSITQGIYGTTRYPGLRPRHTLSLLFLPQRLAMMRIPSLPNLLGLGILRSCPIIYSAARFYKVPLHPPPFYGGLPGIRTKTTKARKPTELYTDASVVRGAAGVSVISLSKTGEPIMHYQVHFPPPCKLNSNDAEFCGAILGIHVFQNGLRKPGILRTDHKAIVDVARAKAKARGNWPKLYLAANQAYEQRHPGTLAVERVRGHSGDVGNEYADKAARAVACDPSLATKSPLPDTVRALAFPNGKLPKKD